LPDDGPIIGSIGRLVPIKDHITLFEAMARVLRQRPDARLVVAGDGVLRSELEARARESLGDRVSFLGWVSDLEALYTAVDVVALTSRNEGTPTALIEAAATSRPVVATRAGGVDDIVIDGKTGSLVPIGDSAAIAAGLLAVLGDPAMARAYGEAGRALVGDRFTAVRLVKDLDALYLELLDRRDSLTRAS
jgi:glycosyltransferase involved in cell wall biosynthesis